MPSFGKKSLSRLKTCHPDLKRLFLAVIEYYDCSILEGFRDKGRQNELYEAGLSKLKFPNGKHNSYPSRAIDVAPYPIDWEDTERFVHFAGYVQAIADQMGIAIRWGGDWDGDNHMDDETFRDYVHFELV